MNKKIKFLIKYIIYRDVCLISRFCIFGKRRHDNIKKRAVIFSCPDHGNAGDIAIEEAEKEFLRNFYKDIRIVNVRGFLKSTSTIRSIRKGDGIYIQGGGSFGGLYDQADAERLALFRTFKKNKIISFPQSLCFTDMFYKKKYSKILKKNKNVWLLFREEASYRAAIEAFPFMGDRIVLTPDIVMSLKGAITGGGGRECITITFRKDKEKKITEKFRNDLIYSIEKSIDGASIREKDTYEEINRCLERKKQVLDAMLCSYSHSKLVITDRLHGMILAYITNTPCIAVSNNNGKVKWLYETWLANCDYISFFDNADVDRIIAEAKRLINVLPKKSDSDSRIENGFEKLAEIIGD